MSDDIHEDNLQREPVADQTTDSGPTLCVKHQAFCDAYMQCRSATEAAVQAGYSPRSASTLMAMGPIRAEIKRRQAEEPKAAGVSHASLLAEIENARAVAEESNNASAMIAAIKLKAEICGLSDPPAPVEPDRPFSREALVRALATFMRENGLDTTTPDTTAPPATPAPASPDAPAPAPKPEREYLLGEVETFNNGCHVELVEIPGSRERKWAIYDATDQLLGYRRSRADAVMLAHG